MKEDETKGLKRTKKYMKNGKISKGKWDKKGKQKRVSRVNKVTGKKNIEEWAGEEKR